MQKPPAYPCCQISEVPDNILFEVRLHGQKLHLSGDIRRTHGQQSHSLTGLRRKFQPDQNKPFRRTQIR